MKPLDKEQFEAIRDFIKQRSEFITQEFNRSFQPQPEQPALLPFNLEEALKNPDRVVYRDGSKPLEWHWFEKSTHKYPITSIDANTNPHTQSIEGGVYDDGEENNYDLFLLPLPEKTYWVNLHNSEGKTWVSDLFDSEEKALSTYKSITYLKTISFTI